MKRCPKCDRTESDDSLAFCRADGTPLIRKSGVVSDSAGTLKLSPSQTTDTTETRILPTGEGPSRPTAKTTVLDGRPPSGDTQGSSKPKSHKAVVLVVAALTAVALAAATIYFSRRDGTAIESIAVLPFENRSSDADAEYLSDGLAESLIYRLSQLPNLRVSPTSSVFRYKGKETDPIKIGNELGVQAVMSGRVAQRGESLTVSVELVDVRNDKLLWGEQYGRRMSELLATQREIATEITNNLRLKLSGEGEQKLARDYTQDAEAYRLYLKGRYHAHKAKRPDIQAGISYFQQALAADHSYALAYVGLSDAYRALTLGGELPPSEFMPKAKAAAQKAIEIEDNLADAHAALGYVAFWYDWDWNAAESQLKRAVELGPNNADSRQFYAHVLSNLGRHAEALAEVKRAVELDPLNLRANTLEGAFLLHAGQTDAALAKLRQSLELDPDFLLARQFAASAYIEKGQFAEAAAEASRATELSPFNSLPMAFRVHALAKSGKRAEARAALEELLKSSTERYVTPYAVAVAYNGLGERDNALAWLGRGVEQRAPLMTFLKVEPKWNDLRSDPRFADLTRRVGLPQ